MVCLLQNARGKWICFILLILFLGFALLANILFGFHTFSLQTFWESLILFDGSTEHIILTTVRLPTALIGAAVGASLAIAGVLMQVLTKNPLASPSILGINSGAVLFIIFCLGVLKLDVSIHQMIYIAFLGAGITALFVLLLGSFSPGGSLPLKLTLAGAAVSAFASSITSGVLLINNESMSDALFWLIGSVSGRKMEDLTAVIPYITLGLILAFFLAKSLNVMMMGDEVAKGLGQRVLFVKTVMILVVILLAGGSVSLAGPIAFVGLMVPHISRLLVGNDHFWLIPYSAIIGSILLVTADILSRYLLMPKEVPVGVTTAILGVPFLIYIARRRSYE